MNLRSVNNPESLSDFNQLSEAQKREWLNSQANALELPDGHVVQLSPNKTFVVSYEKNSIGLINSIEAETLQQAQQRIVTIMLADKAMVPTN